MSTTDDLFVEDDTPPNIAPQGAAPQQAGSSSNVVTFEAAPLPGGLLRAYVKEAKLSPKNPNRALVSFQPDEGPSASAEPVVMWFDCSKSADLQRLVKVSSILGVPPKVDRGRHSFDFGALVGKPCRAMFVPWHKDDDTVEAQIGKFPPSPDPQHKYYSPEFAEWAKVNNFNYETLKGTCGIMPLT